MYLATYYYTKTKKTVYNNMTLKDPKRMLFTHQFESDHVQSELEFVPKRNSL